MHSPSLFSATAAMALFTSSAFAVPKLEKINDAAVTLDLTAQHLVPVPGGSQSGYPVTNITTTSDTHPEFQGASCTGYSWTTTYDAGKETEYVTVVVRLNCETSDGVAFTALEEGSGPSAAKTLRRITYDIGAPYEHMRSAFYMVEIVTPVPDMTVTVWRVDQ